jgi:hypothetical protein
MLKIPGGISDIEYAKMLTPLSVPSTCSQMTAVRIARERWWTSQEFFPASIVITMALHTHIPPEG